MVGGRGWKQISLAAVLLCTLGTSAQGGTREQEGRLWVEAQQRTVRKERSTLSRVSQRALPSVVSITTRQASTSAGAEEGQRGIGSGTIIHQDGYILTSAHVVEGAEEITVSVLSERGFPVDYHAEVVGKDTRTDFALLKIEVPHRLPVLRLSSAAKVGVGDWVVVIGNPFGLAHSVTVGVVSAKGRTDVTPNGRDGDFDYMQMDASINPGNSGGPVLDLNGEVVAVANAVNVAGQGIGFAIPIDIAKAVLPHLYKHGHVRRGWMGISVQDCTPDVAEAYGLAALRGVVVSDVHENGPASRAGLRVGDVIVGLDASRVERAHNLRWQVAARGVGRSVVLRVRRGRGRPMKLRVKLEDLPRGEVELSAPAAATSRPRQHGPQETEGPGQGGSGPHEPPLEGSPSGHSPGREAPTP